MRPTRSRRRSSNFRPSTYYDLDQIEKNGFELLPLVILEMIFLYLSTRDLLNVSCASRMFYLPAMTQLYEKIVVVDDFELIEFFRAASLDSCLNIGTLMTYLNIPKLVQTLKKSLKISRWVRSVRFVTSNVHYIANPYQFEDLTQLVNNTNLTSLYNASLGLNNFNQLIRTTHFNSLRKLCICIDTEILEHDLSLLLPELRELLVYYRNSDVGGINIEILARALVDNGIMSNLESLEFEEKVTKNLNLLNQSNANMRLTIWTNFFVLLGAMKEERNQPKYTKLRNLRLDGFLDDTGRSMSRLISNVFDLSNLRLLKLFIKEFSHLHELHYLNQTSLIKNFIAHCPNLSNLWLNPTFDCFTCQYYNLEETLHTVASRRIPLQSLFLTFELVNVEDSRRVFLLLLNKLNRELLVKLTVFDKTNQVQNENEFRRHLGAGQFSELEQLNYNFQKIVNTLFKYDNLFDFNHKLNVVLDQLLRRFMETNGQAVTEYSNTYLKSIGFESYTSIFPQLRFLGINNINFVVCQHQPRLVGVTDTVGHQ